MDNGNIAGNRRIIAAFDFDGTITTKDSLLLFLLFRIGFFRLMANAVASSLYLVGYKLHLIPNYKAKEKLFGNFYKGVPIEAFDRRCVAFAEKLTKILRPEAVAKLNWHLKQGHEVVIISASIANWIIPWAVKNGIQHVLATKIEVHNGLITGKFLSRNCYGPEKLSRFLEQYPDRDSYELYAYGDTEGDRELLAAADHPFYRTF
ncbi:HAD-IB family hydrolase [Parapedobacter koreensis]|uniref:HAD-superfamily subfamily IB hydrolase, TIGR01490 n=1 Tax=Parapedobacter koreensis TaxID=332977 RepID=A0A1H7IHW5_9SPHI|nr:HAD-IB family hydrolase [Parapedobacter koreensis]SEK61904.1 HAD-superfamily subfamily IB hydrolase, TIGR01490 [Parapedobacter koreensis]